MTIKYNSIFRTHYGGWTEQWRSESGLLENKLSDDTALLTIGFPRIKNEKHEKHIRTLERNAISMKKRRVTLFSQRSQKKINRNIQKYLVSVENNNFIHCFIRTFSILLWRDVRTMYVVLGRVKATVEWIH